MQDNPAQPMIFFKRTSIDYKCTVQEGEICGGIASVKRQKTLLSLDASVELRVRSSADEKPHRTPADRWHGLSIKIYKVLRCAPSQYEHASPI